jgi:membrane-bound lytic murein transglycosylase D
MWQFMPETGRRFGLAQDWWVDERSDPDKATRAAARYLRELYELFGDWNLALASYNAGEGRVSRAMERYGAGDFWTLSRVSNLAQETRNYVPMIHAAIIVARAADRYGFDIAPEAPVTFDTVPVKGAVDLRVIAECVGTGVSTVQSLNPELRRLATPANRTFRVKVPQGKGDSLAGCLDSLPADKRVAFRTHVVGRGQSLASIAKRYGATSTEIAAANSLGSGKALARGTELIIPVKAGAARDLAAGTRTAVHHRVRTGDTLHALAQRYNTTVADLMSWNNLTGTRLATGNLLTIYTIR